MLFIFIFQNKYDDMHVPFDLLGIDQEKMACSQFMSLKYIHETGIMLGMVMQDKDYLKFTVAGVGSVATCTLE